MEGGHTIEVARFQMQVTDILLTMENEGSR